MERQAEMSSTASQLEDLRARIAEVADDERRGGAEDTAGELEEIERLVHTALRRLRRLLGTAR